MVKARIESARAWMVQQIQKLKEQPSNVDEFVTQIQCLEFIEDNYQAVKDRIELNDRIFQICEQFDLPNREEKQSRFIDEVYQLITTLNNAIYDTKEKADKRKDVIKRKIAKKIPKLNQKVAEVTAAVEDP